MWNVTHWHSMAEETWNNLEETLVKWKSGGLVFFWGRLLEKGSSIFLWVKGCDLHRNYSMVVILLSLIFNYDNLILKLHQKKRSYRDEGWLFIDRFKVGSVPGMRFVLVAAKNKSTKIHEYDARSLIKFYNIY